jgi:hypothetical protein
MPENSAILTKAGRAYLADKTLNGEPINVAKIVIANVPNIDELLARDEDSTIPLNEYIVFDSSAHLSGLIKGKVDENTVAFGCVLDQNEGDYYYNWIGVITSDNTLLALDYIPSIRKQQGVNNVHNRSMVLTWPNAQALSEIAIDASSWMFDNSMQLNGIQMALMANATAQITNMYRTLRNMFAITDFKNISKDFK